MYQSDAHVHMILQIGLFSVKIYNGKTNFELEFEDNTVYTVEDKTVFGTSHLKLLSIYFSLNSQVYAICYKFNISKSFEFWISKIQLFELFYLK